MSRECFEWDPEKHLINVAKHGVSFGEAQFAFADTKRIIAQHLSHGGGEMRY